MEGTYLLFGGITLTYVMIQLEFMLRIITAGFLGFLIGSERKKPEQIGWNPDPRHCGDRFSTHDGGFQIWIP